MRIFQEFVSEELSELKTRDIDQLFECLIDNLNDMGINTDRTLDNELYYEIEYQLERTRK